jgi:hypothetical protein
MQVQQCAARSTLYGNRITHTGASANRARGIGINVGQRNFAAIISNTIEDNADVGIIVHEASSARIGFSDVAARGAPNVIRKNQSYAVSPAGTVKGSKRVSQVRRNSTDGLR